MNSPDKNFETKRLSGNAPTKDCVTLEEAFEDVNKPCSGAFKCDPTEKTSSLVTDEENGFRIKKNRNQGAPNQQSNLMKRSMMPLKDISNLTQQKFPRKAEREQEQVHIKSEKKALSTKHREKLEKLSSMCETTKPNFRLSSQPAKSSAPGLSQGVVSIGPVKVCFQNEFIIGNGSRGTSVYVGWHNDGSAVAVKRIVTSSCENLFAENEERILKLVRETRSDHIVNHRWFEPGDPFSYIVLDLHEENLAEYVKSHSAEFLENYGAGIIREILTGLSELHSKEILHMDLKPNNVLVGREGRMRLADFGVSRVLSRGETSVHTDPKGTVGWRAVESMQTKGSEKVRFKKESDVQVAGMVSFYVLTKGRHPFGNPPDRERNILDGRAVDLKLLVKDIPRHFVEWLISNEIEKRPSVDYALTHLFVDQHNIKYR